MLQKLRGNSQGFTLIELMIVIAIIGILAAIAIPNFISYRNKSFCAAVETDANSIAGAIADYFSISVHTATPAIGDVNGGAGITLTGTNAGTIIGVDPTINMTVTVTDGTNRCPTAYQAPISAAASPQGFWSNTTPGIYTKLITQ
ncbi:MAG: prepilin-type N-terminal cleavage/methylation domain-containing protein [Deltaproteobacteria bacterium]|nr:prepilin-type N-terminal cleavage/methylation domain-containing protein [Deltaproteobacteria bacterium]MBW2611643.1 prepilin-type N-terminal cleavage/methylation domain-containing protein [Deltaproteobacteria bacterium]